MRCTYVYMYVRMCEKLGRTVNAFDIYMFFRCLQILGPQCERWRCENRTECIRLLRSVGINYVCIYVWVHHYDSMRTH